MAYNKELEKYIKECVVINMAKDEIVNNLVNSGWTQIDIDDTFATFNAPMAYRNITSNGNTVATFQAPTSTRLITQKEYPITVLWIFKIPIIIILVSIIGIFFGYWFPELLLALPIFLIYTSYQRWKIKFTLSPDLISASGVSQKRKNQDIVVVGKNKKYNINIPYSEIKEVFVKQDLFDMVFGLAYVYIDFSKNREVKKKGFIEDKLAPLFLGRQIRLEQNSFIFPGMTKRNAEIIESIILDRKLSTQTLSNDTVIIN